MKVNSGLVTASLHLVVHKKGDGHHGCSHLWQQTLSTLLQEDMIAAFMELRQRFWTWSIMRNEQQYYYNYTFILAEVVILYER